ncbi:MAG TPA: threonine synthase [Phycisphaerales bacterium]|nr:threonine synthase [Phycisphaerales bacterium]
MSFVTHLESALDGTRYPARTLQTVHEGRPLWVRYDLEGVRRAVKRDDLLGREPTMWRYRELLPVEHDENLVTLGEGITPLLPAPVLGSRLGVRNLVIKDESRLPTGSFKSRGMAMAVSMAKELGVKRLAIPTAGNAGGALAAYASRAGMECFVFMPEDTPIVNRLEAPLFGARAFLVNGLIHQCGKIVGEGAARMGWFDCSTLKEPYRLEGKKTMGLELAEQSGWRLPDHIFYPTGGGTGLIGMWKAFAELEALGWLEPGRKPRMHACQSSGCAPIPEAFERGERFATPPDRPHTLASGLRVPRAVGDFMILDAVRASGGRALASEEDRLLEWMSLACSLEGVSVCPESAACMAALDRCVRDGTVKPDERVVVFNTGAVQKYVEAMHAELPRIDREAVDWARIGSP